MANDSKDGDFPKNYKDLQIGNFVVKDFYSNEREWRVGSYLLDKKIVKIRVGKTPQKTLNEEVELFANLVKVLSIRIVPFRSKDPGTYSEIRMAKILIENEITDFEYSKEFQTKSITPLKDSQNAETPDVAPVGLSSRNNTREVDFFLKKPIKVPLSSEAIQAFEIKGGKSLGMSEWVQRRELRDSASKINTFIVLWQIIDFWDKYGFTELKITDEEAFCQKLFMPAKLTPNSIPTSESSLLRIKSILEKNQITYQYSNEKKWQKVIFLDEPIKVFWSSEPIRAIMVLDDEITVEDYLTKRFLSAQGWSTFLSLPQHRLFWKNWGFVRQYRKK